MLMNLYEEHIIHTLNINKCIKEYDKYCLVSKYIYNLVKNDLNKLFYNYLTISPILENWKYKAHLSKIMYSIKYKLYINNVITYEFYRSLNCNSLLEFDCSIGYSHYHFVAWEDIFSFNNIKWNDDEEWFLGIFYNIKLNKYNK